MATQSPPPPTSFRVACSTTKGPLTFEFIEAWSPIAYTHLFNMFTDHYYDQMYMYRVASNWLTQFGVNTEDKALAERYNWRHSIQDDPHTTQGFEAGTISFAGSGPNSRSSDLFVSHRATKSLGKQPWEIPLGTVVEGFDNFMAFYAGYGEMAPFNKAGPDQQKLRNQGKPYAEEFFPKMDMLLKCDIVGGGEEVGGPIKPFEGMGMPYLKTTATTAALKPPTPTTGDDDTLFILSALAFLLSIFTTLMICLRICRSSRAFKKKGAEALGVVGKVLNKDFGERDHFEAKIM
jgi:cyclophilin family peptidyl-prolyl cis-trans isomerase